MERPVTFLFGAGISRPSKLVLADEMLEGIWDLEHPWYKNSVESFDPGTNSSMLPSSEDSHDIEANITREAIKIVYDYAVENIGFDYNYNYEDLYYTCDQLERYKSMNTALPLLSAAYRELDELLHPLTVTMKRYNPYFRINDLLKDMVVFITSYVTYKLGRQVDIRGLNPLKTLLAEIKGKSTVVTLNQDLLMERYLESQDIDIIDGFSETDNEYVYVYDRSIYSTNNKNKLIKLHGSIDYYYFVADKGSKQFVVKCTASDIWHQAVYGDVYHPIDDYPKILTGTENKSTEYQHGFYLDQMYAFETLLRGSNRLVISGFGWRDKAVVSRILSWLDYNKNNTIILLHRNIDKLLYHYWIKHFNELGKILIIEKYLSEVDPKEVLVHLKS